MYMFLQEITSQHINIDHVRILLFVFAKSCCQHHAYDTSVVQKHLCNSKYLNKTVDPILSRPDCT